MAAARGHDPNDEKCANKYAENYKKLIAIRDDFLAKISKYRNNVLDVKINNAKGDDEKEKAMRADAKTYSVRVKALNILKDQEKALNELISDPDASLKKNPRGQAIQEILRVKENIDNKEYAVLDQSIDGQFIGFTLELFPKPFREKCRVLLPNEKEERILNDFLPIEDRYDREDSTYRPGGSYNSD